jgi:hypothetical protein
MKKILPLCALLLTSMAQAQTGIVEFPYNPDSDGDDFIGITDLLSLLSLYETAFSEEGLYVTSDSTEALYYTGGKTYSQCHKSCNDLPGDWRIPAYDHMLNFDLSALFIGEGTHTNGAWIHLNLNGREGLNNFDSGSGAQGSSGRIIGYGNTGSSASSNGTSYLRNMSLPYQCFCYTRERPKVEYSYCSGGDITACANQKVAGGWYPLQGISSHQAGLAGYTPQFQQLYQAFWRWVE